MDKSQFGLQDGARTNYCRTQDIHLLEALVEVFSGLFTNEIPCLNVVDYTL